MSHARDGSARVDRADPEQGTVRRRIDIVLLIVGLALLAIAALLARGRVYAWEREVFEAVNGLPDWLQPVVWVFNQYGTAVTIPLAAAAAYLTRRRMMALALAASGISVYLLAKVMKEYVERGRPGAVIEAVTTREVFEPGSLGFPSGHAAVAWAITIVLLPRLGRPWQVAALFLAIVVPVVRMYVAAHLPLDLIGGAALGVAAGSAANLIVGVPSASNARR